MKERSCVVFYITPALSCHPALSGHLRNYPIELVDIECVLGDVSGVQILPL